MLVHEAFPIAIGQLEHPEVKKLQDSIDEILLESDITNEINNGLESKLHHWYSHNPDKLEKIEKFKPIASWMKKGVIEYAETVGFTGLELLCTDIWINVNRGGLQYFHNHTNSYFSSTLYVYLDKDDHPELTFDRPGSSPQASTLQLKPKQKNKYQAESYTPKITSGSYLIWPSYLQHGYYNNDKFHKGRPRISISANYMPTEMSNGVYGWTITRKSQSS